MTPTVEEALANVERSVEWLRSIVATLSDEDLAALHEHERDFVLRTRALLKQYDRAKPDSCTCPAPEDHPDFWGEDES